MKHLRYLAALFLLLAGLCSAQPGLTFHRIVNNWPMIELYFTASCDGHDVSPIVASQLFITDNGTAVDNFEIFCADPAIAYPFSVAIVADASGSMSGAGNAGVKEAISNFVRRMDGVPTRNYEVAMNKIRTVITSGMHTVDYAAAVQAGRIPAIEGALTYEGGLLLRRDGQIVGEFSASGASGAQDAQAVRAGMAVIGIAP